MPFSQLFNVDKQLTFYGAYHSNHVNVFIHVLFVPVIMWTAQVMGACLPVPAFVPRVHYVFSDYLVFDLNAPAVQTALYALYYFILEPTATLLFLPQLVLSMLSATAYAQTPGGIKNAVILHVIAWVAQFLGHGLAEKCAPALLDNVLGAVVLAPFFVHLELLFKIGYKPAMHRRIQNLIGQEITRIRKTEGHEKRRKARDQ